MAWSAADLNFAVLKRLDPAVEEVREGEGDGIACPNKTVPPPPDPGPRLRRACLDALVAGHTLSLEQQESGCAHTPRVSDPQPPVKKPSPGPGVPRPRRAVRLRHGGRVVGE